MNDEYTPTTDDVAADYVANRLFVNANIHLTTSRVRAEFDRWLAEYTREQREIAWDEGVTDGQWNELHKYQTTREQIENPYRKA